MIDRRRITGFLEGLVRKNLGLKLLALAVAALLWWFVAAESHIQVGFAVPLEIRNLPERMAITNKVERQVEVRLAGPSSLLGSIRQKDLVATIDLSGAKPGKEVVRLSERSFALPIGVRERGIYPPQIQITLERLERKTLPVIARIGGPANLRRRIAQTSVAPSTLEVEALPGDFSRIRALSTEEVVPDVAKGTFTARARVDLPVEHAKIIGNSDVQVTVRFRE